MKTLLACAAALLTWGAAAQQYEPSFMTFTNGWYMDGGTNNVKGGATNDFTGGGMALQPFDVTRYGEFSLSLFFALTAPGTNNVTFRISNGVESNYWSVVQMFAIQANGTNRVGTNINIYAGSIGWYRLDYAWNTNTPDATNLWGKWSPKPHRLN